MVILDSMGPSFSAGLDRRMFEGAPGGDETTLADLAELDEHTVGTVIAGYQNAFTWWRDSAAITIAAVRGHAVGAGFQLALACDLIVCADDARFAMRETSLGLVPDLGGTGPLVAAVGYGRALEICATGRWVAAQEAVDLGIALAVVPAADLDSAVDELAASLLAAPAGAVRETKALLRNALTATPDEQRQAERAAQARRLTTMRSARAG